MVAETWKSYQQLMEKNIDYPETNTLNKIQELFERIDALSIENIMLKNNDQLLSTKIQIMNTRMKLLESNNSTRLALINKILYDIIDEMIFLQISDDYLKIERKKCPQCNQFLNEDTYNKIKIDIDALIRSVKKIESDLIKQIRF